MGPHQICRLQLFGGKSVSDRDAAHASGFGGLDSIDRIFHDDAFPRAQSEPGSGDKEDVGGGFLILTSSPATTVSQVSNDRWLAHEALGDKHVFDRPSRTVVTER